MKRFNLESRNVGADRFTFDFTTDTENLMPFYMLLIREGAIRDQVQMEAYRRSNRDNPPRLEPKRLAVYGAVETLEGPAPDGVVVLQFPTLEEAKAWYNSPEYQAAIPHRQKAADYRVMIVQGL